MVDLRKEINENEEQFLWRIGQAKDSGVLDCSWEEVADIMNKECREDESEYLGSSAYRKRYQYAKKLFDANVFNSYCDDDTYIEEIRTARQELRKEKQRMFDERTALNKKLRERARLEEDLSNLEKAIKVNATTTLPQPLINYTDSDNDLVICLSDVHFGIDVSNSFGSYNADIAEKRLNQYFEEILKVKQINKPRNAYLILIGDMISGNIHLTTQLENRENVVEQIQRASELISVFTYKLCREFEMVYVNGVSGNHSRLSFKDSVIRDERLDNIIPWYMKAKLDHINNVVFLDSQNPDSTIGVLDIRGKKHIIVHGDFDKFNENGVSRLTMLLGYIPDVIYFGHIHKCSFDDISGVKIIRSGSFSGTCDDYTISKRLSGKPSQMICVVDEDGIKCCYPITLD